MPNCQTMYLYACTHAHTYKSRACTCMHAIIYIFRLHSTCTLAEQSELMIGDYKLWGKY